MTLVEIMVAVAITVGMMLLIGIVFKSATDASGSALALNDVNGQARALTEQLKKDFAGFQSDLPLAIIFEAHQNHAADPLYDPGDSWTWLGDPDDPNPYDPAMPAKLIRYDRICFFANGDFHPPVVSIPLSGNLARIFYGQMLDSPLLEIENDVSAPRQILARRQKIMTVSNAAPPAGVDWTLNPTEYDADPFEFTPMGLIPPLNNTPGSPATFWKNEPAVNFAGRYFNDLPLMTGSFVRRPLYANLAMVPDALQQLHFLSDVTDFKIQLYLFDKIQQRWRWFPDDQDMKLFSPHIFALYWNVSKNPDDMDATNNPTPIPTLIAGANFAVPWYSSTDDDVLILFDDNWPRAIRFTFTLYDKNRQRFGEGQTYSYIVKIPPRY